MAYNPNQPDQNSRFKCCRCKVRTDRLGLPGQYRGLTMKNATISCNGEACTHNPFKCQPLTCYTVKVRAMQEVARNLIANYPREEHQIPICTWCKSQNLPSCNAETQYKCTACTEDGRGPCVLAEREANPAQQAALPGVNLGHIDFQRPLAHGHAPAARPTPFAAPGRDTQQRGAYNPNIAPGAGGGDPRVALDPLGYGGQGQQNYGYGQGYGAPIWPAPESNPIPAVAPPDQPAQGAYTWTPAVQTLTQYRPQPQPQTQTAQAPAPAQPARSSTGGSLSERPERPNIKQDEYHSAEEREINKQEADARLARQAGNQAASQNKNKRITGDRSSSTPSSGGSAGPSQKPKKNKNKPADR